MKLDCIVTWWGRLVEKSGRSLQDKWKELLWGIPIGERVLQTVMQIPQIDKIVYAGDIREDSNRSPRIVVTPAIPEKHFFQTIAHAMRQVQHDIDHILIVAGDLPLIDEYGLIDIIEQWGEKWGDLLTVFTCTNWELQDKYRQYNPGKRCIETQDGTMIFGNAFIIHRTLIEKLKEVFLKIDSQDRDYVWILLWVWRLFGIRWLSELFAILPYAQVKKVDSWLRKFRCIVPAPSEDTFERLANRILGSQTAVRILKCGPELAVDFDRRHQQNFFERTLQEKSALSATH
jgi:hypothetical protein